MNANLTLQTLKALARRAPGRSHREGSMYQPAPAPPYVRISGEAPAAPRAILGVSAFYHDAAAALLFDGEIVAGAHEERLSRVKHDARFPTNAIEFCLERAGLTREAIDLVAFYEEPILKADRVATVAARYPALDPEETMTRLRQSGEQMLMADRIRRALGVDVPVAFVQHHVSHMAGAAYLSPFADAAALVMDGVGEWATVSIGEYANGKVQLLEQIEYPHSLGLFYSALTEFLGFAVNDAEYKVMALASYGTPRFESALRRVLQTNADGSFSLDMKFFEFHVGRERSFSDALAELLGVAPRAPSAPVERAHEDIAASLQLVTDGVVAGLMRRAQELTGRDRIVVSGGVAMNGVAVTRAFRQSGMRDIFVPPDPGDGGAAAGAALYVDRLSAPREPRRSCVGFQWGPSYEDAEISAAIAAAGLESEDVAPELLAETVAGLLAGGAVVGWFQGRMECGPRALGARSILADPGDEAMRDRVNAKVKYREGFRPFAPMVTEEDAATYFDGLPANLSRYMLSVVDVREAWRSRMGAIVHVDGTARPQIVSRDGDPRTYALLRAFERVRGIPVLLNTSFNLAGEPIVCSPTDAIKTFQYSDIDVLVLGERLIRKEREAS